ncbi:FAD-dependent monooxygenase [Rhodococcus qingshengii]|uniref:FAD-dependent monooxygenase n=1 Tax=Rhodococcus qingshengii TaxID=334542 RepID=UPI0035DAD29E
MRLIDKATDGFMGSRAKGIQPRTLEIMEDMGVLEPIHAGGALYPKMGVHIGRATIPWTMIKTNKSSAAVPYPSTWLIPQWRTDRALHDRLRELGGRIEFNCAFEQMEQDEDGVNIRVASLTGEQIFRAKYVIGADGGSSSVRKSVGIAFVGETNDQDQMLIVDAAVEGNLSRDRWHIWPLGGKFVGACPIPNSDLFQWMIKIDPAEGAPTTPEMITARVQSRTKTNYRLTDIRWQSIFRPNIRIAESYRKGRVFLVGDAAHVHPPTGAQGLNTGLQDSYNLAWKIAQVVEGGTDALLDSYEAERQPVASTALGLAGEKYDNIATMSPSSLKRGKDEYQLAITYYGGPLAPKASASTETLRVGDRAPDARLAMPGTTSRLFEYFCGTHFTAIVYRRVPRGSFADIGWPANGARLRVVAIESPTTVASVNCSDLNGNFRRTYGVSRPTTVIVRPDGYIAAILPTPELRSIASTITLATGMH